jgi:hypothetical protein
MEKVIPIHLSSIPHGGTSCDHLGVYVNPMGKSVSLSHWPPSTPHGAFFVALVLGVDPMEKCFHLPTIHPSIQNIHPSIHPKHPSFTHTAVVAVG